MKNNNYVSVGDIIEQERLKRQSQITKGIVSNVYDHIEKARQDDLSNCVETDDNFNRFASDVDNLNKSETEFLLSKLQRQIVIDPQSSILKSFRSIAINHLNELRKAVYTDNAQNRKLGRVGQEYSKKKKNVWDDVKDPKERRRIQNFEEYGDMLAESIRREKQKKDDWTPPYDLNLEVAERLWTEKESSAYDDALANEDQKSQNKLLKIAFDRAKKKNINIKAVD